MTKSIYHLQTEVFSFCFYCLLYLFQVYEKLVQAHLPIMKKNKSLIVFKLEFRFMEVAFFVAFSLSLSFIRSFY